MCRCSHTHFKPPQKITLVCLQGENVVTRCRDPLLISKITLFLHLTIKFLQVYYISLFGNINSKFLFSRSKMSLSDLIQFLNKVSFQYNSTSQFCYPGFRIFLKQRYMWHFQRTSIKSMMEFQWNLVSRVQHLFATSRHFI